MAVTGIHFFLEIQASNPPWRSWAAFVAGLFTAAHLVHPRAAVVFAATKDKASLGIQCGAHIKAFRYVATIGEPTSSLENNKVLLFL